MNSITTPVNSARGEVAKRAPEQNSMLAPPPLPVLPETDPDWMLQEHGFSPAREHEIESLFAVSNGYLGARAALPEGVRLSDPATFVAGVFERATDPFPSLMAAPSWVALALCCERQPVKAEGPGVLERRRMLDMRRGIVWRELRYQDHDGRVTRILGFRLASLADRHLLVHSVAFCAENYSGRLRLESRVEMPKPVSLNPGVMAQAVKPAQTPGPLGLKVRVPGTEGSLGFAARSLIWPMSCIECTPVIEETGDALHEVIELRADIAQWIRVDRLVCVYSTRDTSDPLKAANAHLERAIAKGTDRLVQEHIKAWEARWDKADVQIDGSDEDERTIRFACYHLISAANPEDERVSIGARALTGTSYKGHVFWDTEIYMLPFYVYTDPPSARALLMYRYHVLDAARAKARAHGYAGAMYPWESADTGEEVTPSAVISPSGEVIPVLNGEQEQHITADVAYGVWLYWHATRDEKFLLEAGAEIMFETARFWASRGRIEADGQVHIRHVIGPDEYHEAVDDNVFTNLMAQWNLEQAAGIAELIQQRWPEQWQRLTEKLRLTSEEPVEWKRLASLMYSGFDPKTGLFEQFRGFFALDDVNLAAYEPRTVPMDVLMGHARIQHVKVVKQADVLMAMYLLWDRFPPAVRRENFLYYDSRTGHGSSLSPSIHALLAARLGDIPLAERYFKQASEIDLANNMGNAAGGVHAAALGGLWQAVVFGFAGLYIKGEELWLCPNLPSRWKALRFPFQWRGVTLRIAITKEPMNIEIEPQGNSAVRVAAGSGPAVELQPRRRYRTLKEGAGWQKWEEVHS